MRPLKHNILNFLARFFQYLQISVCSLNKRENIQYLMQFLIWFFFSKYIFRWIKSPVFSCYAGDEFAGGCRQINRDEIQNNYRMQGSNLKCIEFWSNYPRAKRREFFIIILRTDTIALIYASIRSFWKSQVIYAQPGRAKVRAF